MPDWQIENNVECVVCPACEFTFAAHHDNCDDGSYSCPNCEEHRLAAIVAVIDRSGMDISPCMECGEPVVCIPDGMPLCATCGAKEQL